MHIYLIYHCEADLNLNQPTRLMDIQDTHKNKSKISTNVIKTTRTMELIDNGVQSRQEFKPRKTIIKQIFSLRHRGLSPFNNKGHIYGYSPTVHSACTSELSLSSRLKEVRPM